MNKTLEAFARDKIREGLAQLPEGWQEKFKKMYGSVDTMPAEKLDWALTQVENSIRKYEHKLRENRGAS